MKLEMGLVLFELDRQRCCVAFLRAGLKSVNNMA